MQLTFESPVVIRPLPEPLSALLVESPVALPDGPPAASADVLLDERLASPVVLLPVALPVLLALAVLLAFSGSFAIATELEIAEIVDESEVSGTLSIVALADCGTLDSLPVPKMAARSAKAPAAPSKPTPSSRPRPARNRFLLLFFTVRIFFYFSSGVPKKPQRELQAAP